MSRLDRAARQVRYDTAAADTVRSNFIGVLHKGGPTLPTFVARVLHGEFGLNAAGTVWLVMEQGIAKADVHVTNATRISFGA